MCIAMKCQIVDIPVVIDKRWYLQEHVKMSITGEISLGTVINSWKLNRRSLLTVVSRMGFKRMGLILFQLLDSLPVKGLSFLGLKV